MVQPSENLDHLKTGQFVQFSNGKNKMAAI
jgi:hypothetical protein